MRWSHRVSNLNPGGRRSLILILSSKCGLDSSPIPTRIALLFFIPVGVSAGLIRYDASSNTIFIRDFSRDHPATLAAVEAADRRNGWKKIRRNGARRRVTANFVIGGRSTNRETWFQLGDEDDPSPIVEMEGDLRVASPPAVVGKYRRFQYSNGLSSGVENNRHSRPALLFLCKTPGQHGLVIEDGVVLRLRRTTVAAAHRAFCRIECSDFLLDGCRFSGMIRECLERCQTGYGLVRKCTFENARAAVSNGLQYFEDCLFRQLESAIRDEGCLEATFIRCRFEKNERNFAFGSVQGRGITTIDCFLGRSRRSDEFRAPVDRDTGRPVPAVHVDARHVVVMVTDLRGRPIPGAHVSLTCEQNDPFAEMHATAVTDGSGRTPPPTSEAGLLVAVRLRRAVSGRRTRRKKIHAQTFTFRIVVRDKGFRPRLIRGFRPLTDRPFIRVALSR